MPTNQSSPWDGRKPRPLPSSPATAAFKVPSAAQTGDGSSTGTDRAKDQSLWGGGAEDQTAPSWRLCTTVPPGSVSLESVPPRSVPPGPISPGSLPTRSVSPESVPPGSLPTRSVPPSSLPTRSVSPESVPPGSLPTRSVSPESVPPGSLPTRSVPPSSLPSRSIPPRSVLPGLKRGDRASGRPPQLVRRPNTELLSSRIRVDSSTPPPQCLQHQRASSSSSSSSSRATRRVLSGKVSRRRPVLIVRSRSAERQLLVRGRPPAGFSSAGAGNKPGGAGQEAQLTADSVTSQISSICLSTPAPPTRSSPPPAGPPACGTATSSGHRCGMQVEVVEEEEPDEVLENDLSDDGESDCCSITASSSCTSITAPCSIEEPMSAEDGDEHPALVPSLFPLVAPTLYFSTANEKVELLPAEQRRLLKWKMSTVTPNVVKHTIARSHFKVTKKSSDWLGCWGHHMKSAGFKTLAEHQKLNHFPGTFQIGRKDRLWRNLSKMQLRFGKQEFGFFPRTFVLPQDIKLLRKAWEDGGSKQKWIVKPPASARGIGIQVIHKWSQLPRKRPLLVQKYLHKPYLIGGNKFDLRIYVYVTSYDPLRVYIFSDGLVRFASCKYSSSMKTLGNKFMHLTNYSVNKKNAEYQSNSDDKACQGHKWALKALWQYLGSRGVDTTLIWEKIKDIVIKTIIASEPYVNTLLKMNVRSASSCHELFGFDIMLDENLKPWILEVNISPSLHSNTALDVSIKGQMIRDLLNLAGFRIPPREETLSPSSSASSSVSSSASSSSSSLSGSVRERSRAELSADEKVKRAFYLTQRCSQPDFLSSVLDVLTPEDVRVLSESEDELSRRGDFQRVFPAAAAGRYLRFFECPRYLNLLLDQWEQRHWSSRDTGIGLLRTLCQRGVHLGTSDPAHMWSKCSYISRCEAQQQELVSPSRSRVVVSHRNEEDSLDRDGSSDRQPADPPRP